MNCTYDTIGNLLTDGTWTYTWQNGRELSSMTSGSTTWTYTYDANGMRTSRSNGSTAYTYVYNGSRLTQMKKGNDTLYFTYGVIGPTTVTWNGTTYYYAVNGQGDVMGIFDGSGNCVVTYNWDNAWGYNPEPEGSMADTLGTLNPLRYRGNVYDTETGLYYLQSRYYNPAIGRFINADDYVATGQGLMGNNMFSYCGNNPVSRIDSTGEFFNTICGAVVGAVISAATREAGESLGEALLRGAVTGAVAGAGLDICIATGGVGGLVIAGVFGAGAAMGDTAWEAHNNGKTANAEDIVLNGVIGGGLNVMFGAAGREVGRAVGNTIKSAAKAIWTNTIKSVTNKAGRVVLKKVVTETAKNLLSSAVQGSFGKIYSLIGSKMLEVFN